MGGNTQEDMCAPEEAKHCFTKQIHNLGSNKSFIGLIFLHF